jgi:hypothetical protein
MPNYKACLILIFFLVLAFKGNAQSSVSGNKEDNSDTTIAVFKDGISGLGDYFRKITPIISANTKDESNLPARLNIIFTISKTGKVTDVEFPNTNMESDCKSKVRDELLKMRGWKAAERNGKPIVSKYPFRISCFLWSY